MDPERFDAFARKLGEGARRRARLLSDDYWRDVQDVFTRDVTSQGLRQLVEDDTRDAFRFFARDVDLERLRTLPWYERWPRAALELFLATAHRLSPARRLLFAGAVPVVLVGWIRYLSYGGLFSAWRDAPFTAALVSAASALLVLLVLELRDKLSLKGDLEVARQIQFGLVPEGPLLRPGLAIHALMRPANTVGGDYYDVIEQPGAVTVVVGDVAGKGMPAALLMALLQGSLRTLLTAGFRGADLCAKLNTHLQASIPSNRLVTLFLGEYEPSSGRLRYVNAGHNPPLLLRASGIERLGATGVALGILEDAAFEEGEVALAAGDRLLLYTDGIVEAENARDEEYGEGRLDAMLVARRSEPAASLVSSIRDEVLAFCGGVRPRDDMTLMVLDRLA
jgi:serine phosphatase RsbU (regulator of sigma subunit)